MTDLLTTGDSGPGARTPQLVTPATTTRGAARPIRMNLLDRPWAGHWTGVVVTPIRVPGLPDVRAIWRRLVESLPETPMACSIDNRARSWMPVPTADRDAHVERSVIAIDDPATDEADAFLARSLHLLAPDQSILVGVGERTLLLLWSHQIGDAATTTTFIRALLDHDEPALAALANRADLSVVTRALRTQARAHGREWWATARRRTDAPTKADDRSPVPANLPAGPAGDPTRVVSVRWAGPELQQIARWRSRNAKGTSITTVLTAATHRALVGAGLPMEADGFHSLVDLRRYLPSDSGFVAGNLAKSVRIHADLNDLQAISEASREAIDTARPVASTVIGSVADAVGGILRHGRRPGHAAPTPGAVAMTFNSMPALPGLSELPWLPGEAKQYVGVGYPAGPRSLTVFAMRMREHMQVTVTFPASMIDVDLMRRTLLTIPDELDRLMLPTTG